MTSALPPEPGKKKPKVSTARITIWIVVGVVAVYMIVTGLVGVIAKG